MEETENFKICLFEYKILFCKRTGTVSVNAVKYNLRRLWLVAVAIIFNKTFKIYFPFMSASPRK